MIVLVNRITASTEQGALTGNCDVDCSTTRLICQQKQLKLLAADAWRKVSCHIAVHRQLQNP